MSFAFFHRYPFLRLLLSLGVGIYAGDELFFQGWKVTAGYSFLLIFALLGLLLLSYYLKRYAFRWLFGGILFLFFFITGGCWMNLRLQQTVVDFPSEEVVYRVLIAEKPEQKERSLLCQVWASLPGDSTRLTAPKSVLLYLTNDSLSRQLQQGDELLVAARIAAPVTNGNPDEFDYPRYLARKQVSGTGFCSAENWKRIAHRENLSFRQQALACREKILNLYRKQGFSDDEFAVLSALTVGYKDELSEEIQETYSVSGASHVLALSGLHIAFLYGLLLFCLKGFPERWWCVRLFRAVVVLVLLWGFAFFTGLSPSVVRSVVMCSLFTLSRVFERQSFSLNTLCIAAFFMLLFQPAWLFDVGFQLSFCAVAAILLIQPVLYRMIPVSNRFSKYVWGLMTVSVAAQIGTTPLVVLYFSRFSTHFLLTNLLVIPLVSVIIYAAVLLLVLTPFSALQAGMAVGVKYLVGWLNASAQWVEHLPGASVDNIWLYPLEAFLIYLSVLLLMYYWNCRRGKALIFCLLSMLSLMVFHTAMQLTDRPQKSLVFYNVRGCPAVHCIAADGHSWLAYADSLPDEKRLSRVASRYWQHLHLATPCSVTTDVSGEPFSIYNQVLSFSGWRVCIVSDNRWRNKSARQPLSIDYLYLCKGYNGRLKGLIELFSFRTVILDASLSEYRREAFEQECRDLGIHFISLAEKGSVRFLL